MDAILILMFAHSLCNESTMTTSFGEKCVKIVEKYSPVPVVIPSKFGAIRTNGVKCYYDDKLISGECVKTRVVIKK